MIASSWGIDELVLLTEGKFASVCVLFGFWDTFEKVKSIVVEQLGVDEKEVKMDAAYIDDLGADSLDIVELIMAFEEEFNIEIPDDVAEKIKTVKDTVDYIEKEKKA